MDQARELVFRIEDDAPKSECDAAYAVYFAGWEHLKLTCAPVIIAGPSELGEQAENLQYQLAVLGQECDSWHEAHKKGPTRSRDDKIVELQHAVNATRKAFISAAQKHIDLDLSERG